MSFYPWKDRHEVVESGCWIITGRLDPWGYGQKTFEGKNMMAHRAYHLQYIGPIPDGHQVDHLCMVASCVNPSHLEPVTPAENNLRRCRSKTHCPQGHDYESNHYMDYKGHRRCRTCMNERQAIYYHRRKQEA